MATTNKNLFDGIDNGDAWDAAVVFNRTNAVPLDKNSVRKSKSDLDNYAGSTTDVAYPGEILSVADSSKNYATPYIINNDGSTSQIVTEKEGNAPSAKKLATARNINGTSFDGTGNITTANWGTTRKITIGSTEKEVNGSTNVSWTLDDIGAARGYHSSGETSATAGWYRIAQSGKGISTNIGIFRIKSTISGNHSATILTAGTSYGNDIFVQQLSHTEYTGQAITKARIVSAKSSNYSNNYAYLEVYLSVNTKTVLDIVLTNSTGWTLITPTAGSIPSNYNSKEITFTANSIVSNVVGNATTATTATNLTNNPTLAASGNNIKVTAGGKTSSEFTVPFATTATKLATTAIGGSNQPVYFNSSGQPATCTSYANATVKKATEADKLTVDGGDSNTPVYFSNGIPVACASLDLNTSGYAAKLRINNNGTTRTYSVSFSNGVLSFKSS